MSGFRSQAKAAGKRAKGAQTATSALPTVGLCKASDNRDGDERRLIEVGAVVSSTAPIFNSVPAVWADRIVRSWADPQALGRRNSANAAVGSCLDGVHQSE